MTSTMTPVLETRDLAVAFDLRHGPVPAIRGVSLRIARGEILGVVGESGAGKSLTGTAVTGLLEPPGRIAGGEILLEGERIDGLPARAMRRIRGRRIGVVFQDPLTSLNPLLRVGDQLVETIRAHLPLSRSAARARALALLQEVGIPAAAQRIGHYPHQFSGGMRQRVVIALALAADPVLLIADEPTTALDVSVQAQVTGLIKRLCRERGMAVMLVTHDMGVIAETADQVAVLYAGRVVEVGPVGEVLRAPRHPYTRGLMAAIPTMQVRRERLAQIDGAMPRLDSMPRGCAFHPRCPAAMAACREAVPALTGPEIHRAACLLAPGGIPEEMAA
ncbi:MAG: methionine ABC transporter ATP-binding protein [Azospirillum brasilense]|nr:MAG: methionine ABC transporter ATP-binding protein [Azospirillum brasilense]